MTTSSPQITSATIRVVRPDQQNRDTSQTSGSLRLSAISAAKGIDSALWAGMFVVGPSDLNTGDHLWKIPLGEYTADLVLDEASSGQQLAITDIRAEAVCRGDG